MDKLDNMWNKLSTISETSSGSAEHTKYIPKLESLVEAPLPDDFKQFLLKVGGYKTITPDSYDRSYVIKLPKLKGGRVSLPLSHSVSVSAMIDACDDWGDSLPDQSILIEYSGDGSPIFMSMLPGATGEIYFMERDHYLDSDEFDDYECEEDACDAFDPKNGVVPNIFSKLADSFYYFIMAIELEGSE